MLHKTAKHIHRWRVYFLLGITALFLYYAQLNPLRIGQFVGAKMGQAVGMTTSVPENPFNKLAAQLEEKQDSLDAREAALDAREADLATGSSTQQKLLLFVAIGIVVLFVLILLNFYYDWHRQKRQRDKGRS